MKFRDLLAVLEAEHWRRYSRPPWGSWRQWLWQPWVREFLRTYTPPAVVVVRRTP